MTSHTNQQNILEHEATNTPLVPTHNELPILQVNTEWIDPEETHSRRWAITLGMLSLVSVLFLPNLGSFGLWDPWETHYGEVTRYMIETGDWVHPWWGYKGEKIGSEKGPGEHFYSKPILIFWMEAATVRLLGLSELAIRLPIALIAMFTVLCVYFVFARILSPRQGLASALVLATCPQFYFLSRQAQTDMPYVGTMTIALCFFCLAVFGPSRRITDKQAWTRLCLTTIAIVVLIAPQLGIITADVEHAVTPGANGAAPSLWMQWRYTGLWQAATYIAVLVPVLISMFLPTVRELRTRGSLSYTHKDRLTRQCALWLFYSFCALSFMAKGLLGFALPGLIIFVYLLIGNDWALLIQKHDGKLRGRVELIRGILIFLCVGLPWYVALLSGPEGRAFWNRFFIHDHFNRLGSGVHAIDDGTFEHFLKWLGYGMWPWAGFVPAAVLLVNKFKLSDTSPKNRLKLFVFLWFLLPYALFTLSSTKFHHYIFPALPPLALLTGWALVKLLKERGPVGRATVAVALGLFVMLTFDIHRDPQHLRNLFTYKYDRELPAENERPVDQDAPIKFDLKDKSNWEPDQTWGEGDFYTNTPEFLHAILNTPAFRFKHWIPLVAGLGVLAMLMMLMTGKMRLAGLVILSITAISTTVWSLNFYMPALSPHWSQKHLFDRYYDVCVMAPNSADMDYAFQPLIADVEPVMELIEPRSKQVCKEEVISWLLTWRGETFYSHNTIRPIQKEKEQFQPYLKELNRGARFFVHIERTRAKGFKSRVESHLKKLSKNKHFKGIKKYNVTLEHNENYWFVLLKADPVCKPTYTQDEVGRCLPQSANGRIRAGYFAKDRSRSL